VGGNDADGGVRVRQISLLRQHVQRIRDDVCWRRRATERRTLPRVVRGLRLVENRQVPMHMINNKIMVNILEGGGLAK